MKGRALTPYMRVGGVITSVDRLSIVFSDTGVTDALFYSRVGPPNKSSGNVETDPFVHGSSHKSLHASGFHVL